MWMQVTVNGRAVHTRYLSPVTAGTYSAATTTSGLTRPQLRSREAHHEAGHAVIAMALGLPVTAVHLYPNPAPVPGAEEDMHHLGHTALGPFHADVHDVLVFLAAGVRAAHRWLDEQDLLNPHSAFFNDVLGGSGDQERMISLATARPIEFTWGAERSPHVPSGHDHVEMASKYGQADELIHDNWGRISTLAHELLACGSVDASRLWSLHQRHTP